ncbi:MAG: DNA polymerase I [Brevinema sp.]
MKKKMILVDASGLLFRSYFAMLRTQLRTKTGQPTSAIFGFLRMLFNLIKKYSCHQIVTAWDVPRSSLERTKNYKSYKATRKETPPDLIEQIPLAKECLELAEIPALLVEGHEADDVLASLVKKYKNDYEIIIFTGDKDLLQLVQDGVFVAIPDKNSPDGVKILDRDGVKVYKGVYPEEIADYLAILGDSSDNVPGIKGIGEKGAVALINEYHSLANIYQNISSVKPSLVKKLEEGKENGLLSLELIRLQEDLDVLLSQASDDVLSISHFVTDSFTKRLQELELFSLLKELSLAQGASKDETLSLFGQKSQDVLINDFSLNTLDILSKSVGVGFQFVDNALQFSSTEEVFRLDIDRIEEFQEMIQLFFDALDENEKRLVVFDQKSLLHVLKPYRITLPLCDDIKIMAYLLDPARNNYTVEYLSLAYLGKNEITARIFYELKQHLGKMLVTQGMGKVYYQIDMPLRPILFALEDIGVALDTEVLKKLSLHLGEQLEVLEQTIYHLAGKEFNILSPKQLGQILFEDLALKPYKKTKTKSYSTDEESLEFLALSHPLPKEVLLYRSLSKFKNTYTDALPKLIDQKGRIHTTLYQTVTSTGRLSSGEPNLQNIPIRTEIGREIRKAFVPSVGKKIISVDYSQIELRLFASLSKDLTMIEFFKSGGDVHRHTASAMFHIPESSVSEEQRRAAKTVNYGISYGMSVFRLANTLGIEFVEARDFVTTYFETFPGIQQFMIQTLELACSQGFVSTVYGRRRPTLELFGKTPDKITNLSHPSRFAINAVIQGTAADIIKIAMIKINDLIQESYQDKVVMILQVHDELLFEADEASIDPFKKDLKTIMTSLADFLVPLEVEIGVGNNWDEAH